MHSVGNSLKSWDSLIQLEFQDASSTFGDNMIDSFVYNGITYCDYKKVWSQCEEKTNVVKQFPYFYSDQILERLFDGKSELNMELLKEIEDDVILFMTVSVTPFGRDYYLRTIQRLESFLICLLGHPDTHIRYFATIMLNVLYDGHTWQLSSPFPTTVAEVDDPFILPELQEGFIAYVACPIPSNELEMTLNNRIIRQVSPDCLPALSLPGYYDWVIMDANKEIHSKGRYVVLPKGTNQHSFYQIPIDFEHLQKTDNTHSFDSILQLVQQCLPNLSRNFDTILLSSSCSHTEHDELATADAADEHVGLDLSSVESSPAEEYEEHMSVDSKSSQFSLSGVHYGTSEELSSLLQTMNNQKMRLALPINPNCPLSHSKQHDVVYIREGEKQRKHPGTDGKETEWESEVLPNYRMLSEWNGFIERIVRLYYDDHINSFFLQDGQSLPIILSTDIASCSSTTERMNGLYVLSNEEGGFWNCQESDELQYPNPFLVKLTRKVYELCPDALLCSNAYWNRSESILQCGILPICDDCLSTLSRYGNISIGKNGMVDPLEESGMDPVDDLACFSHLKSSIGNASSYFIHYICNESTPYPTMTLKRATWSAVCLLYTLPSMTMCYYKEDEGRCLKITQGEEYTVTSTPYTQLLTTGKQDVMEMYSTKLEPHVGARIQKKVIHLSITTDATITEVFVVGSFNGWDPHQDAMILCKTENQQNSFELYLELYSGLYYYKFYFPAKQMYIHDEQNHNKVPDPYGGFNSILEIPIQTHLKHPLLQSPQMKADVWWSDLNPEEKQIRRYSYTNLGVLSGDTKVKRVTSWLKMGSTESLSDRTLSTTPSFSLSYSDVSKLCDLEDSIREEIGPQFGFDIHQICQHYAYFRQLRKEHSVLQHGSLFPLHIKPSTLKIASFCRYAENIIFIVIASFESEPCTISLCLDELLIPIQSTSQTKDGLWHVTRVREETTCLWSADEIKSRVIQFSLLPFDYSLINMQYQHETTSEERSEYLKQAMSDLQSTLQSTRPIGQQFYEAQHIWSTRMISEQTVLQELQNNSIFTTVCTFVKDCIDKNSGMEALFSWYLDICKICSVTSLSEQSTLLREILFYTSYCYNSESDGITDRNDLVLHHLQRLTESSNDQIAALATEIIHQNQLESIVIITPELGKWSTVGGLGVMVDNLSKALAKQGQNIIVISPYYDRNRYGQTDYLKKDGIGFEVTLPIRMPSGEEIQVGFHRGTLNNITYVFFHQASVFMRPYPSGSPTFQMQCQLLMALAPLTYCTTHGISPSIILTNDWPCGLVATMARMYYSTTSIASASFFHIIHNLDDNYEGRIYPDGTDTLQHIHRLPVYLLQDPYWNTNILNPSRCVLLSTDNWGTVSNIYQEDIQNNSALAPLLRRFPQPFSSPNGVLVCDKQLQYAALPTNTHTSAKLFVQGKYFGVQNLNIPLFVFVGRITEQKGVHLICEVAEELILSQQRNIQIIVGGIANEEDPYGRYCINKMKYLRSYYSDCFWCNPYEFFTDGFVCNLAADFGLMPSLFEPCGIVQDEFFVAGTPVIAFSTGGLKETVKDWNGETATKNGFLFLQYSYHDLLQTIHRALTVYKNPIEYNRLREMTSCTSIDVADQARDYISEFYRMRRCILPSVQIPFYYSFTSDKTPKEVFLVADFTEWAEHPIPMRKMGNRFYVSIPLKKGRYFYKFLVDGKWCIRKEDNVYKDCQGCENHVITVPESTNFAITKVLANMI